MRAGRGLRGGGVLKKYRVISSCELGLLLDPKRKSLEVSTGSERLTDCQRNLRSIYLFGRSS